MRLNGPGLWEQSSSPTCPPSLSGCIHVLEIKSQLSNDTAELNVLTFQVQSTLCLCHYDIRCNTHIEYDTHTQEHNEHTRSVLYHLFNRMTGVKWECVCVCVRVCAAYECSLNLMEGDASRCSCTRVQPLNTHTHTLAGEPLVTVLIVLTSSEKPSRVCDWLLTFSLFVCRIRFCLCVGIMCHWGRLMGLDPVSHWNQSTDLKKLHLQVDCCQEEKVTGWKCIYICRR